MDIKYGIIIHYHYGYSVMDEKSNNIIDILLWTTIHNIMDIYYGIVIHYRFGYSVMEKNRLPLWMPAYGFWVIYS